MKDIVIVMPVYEDVAASNILFAELKKTLGSEIFLVVVDDGSTRQPQEVANLEQAGVQGVVLKLRRNVGHQKAIAIGLNYVAENWPATPFTVVMDSDGEDLPSSIPSLMEAARSDQVDLAVSRRKSRMESIKFKLFYVVYKFLFQLFTGRNISFGNFMVLKPAALVRMAFMHELGTHVAACAIQSKLRLALCPLDRGPRYAGRSKMNFVSLALHGFRALMVFSEDVLVRVGVFCALAAGGSVALMAASVLIKSLGLASPGWFSLSLGILGLIILQSLALGVMALMSLMLTGAVRGGAQARVVYGDYIQNVSRTRG